MDKAFIEANFIKPAGPVSERQGGRQRMTLPAPVGRIGTGPAGFMKFASINALSIIASL